MHAATRHTLAMMSLIAVAAGCSGTVDAEGAQEARAPLVGSADAAGDVDVADHECRVVLRRADHLVDARGQGVLATIDVDEKLIADPGATPGVLFRADGSGWQEVAATATDGAPAGFKRYQARFLAWQSADFIAFARTTTQVRLFDHNRLPGDFDSFHVDASNGFAVAEDASSCPGQRPLGTLEFRGNWVNVQHGAVVAGDQLRIDYDLSRLQTCRDTHNGYRFWSLDAYAQFQPGGELVSGSVVGSNGTTIYPQPFVTDVPADATSVQIWFVNATAATGCVGYDSNYGANYRFAVEPRATPAIGWLSGVGGSTNRACDHADGLADPIVIDEYARERACLFADVDVWVGGVTDGAVPHPQYLYAQVEWHKDAQPATQTWLDDIGRFGNNERFRWQLPYELRSMADWTTATYALRFSVDGRTWSYAEGGRQRTVQRAFTLP
jgi:Family of unknown function (DUF6209)